MSMRLMFGASVAASSLACSQAFVPVSTGLRGTSSLPALEAAAPSMTEQPEARSYGFGHLAAAAGCAAVAAASMSVKSTSSRKKSRAAAIVAKAEESEYLPGYKMSPAVPYCVYPEMCEGWVGGEKGFDPLRISDVVDIYNLREMELKHGRVCMLAVVGWVVTDIGIRFPGEIFQQVKGPLEAHDEMLEAGIMQQMLGVVAAIELWGNFLQREGRTAGREAGDFFIGKNFLPKDEEGVKTMKLKELENGRLAMMAFSGIVTQAALYPEKHFPFF